MDLLDLLFIAVALATVITSIAAAATAIAGRPDSARRTFRRLAIGLGAYGLIVLISSATVPRRAVAVGERMCFDDWCIRVDSVSRAATRYTVAFSVISDARRVTQRERGLAVYLEDTAGHRAAPNADPKAVPFDVPIGPGESFQATRTFAVSPDQQIDGVAVVHTGFPIEWFIIGSGPFRLPPLIRFSPAPTRATR